MKKLLFWTKAIVSMALFVYGGNIYSQSPKKVILDAGHAFTNDPDVGKQGVYNPSNPGSFVPPITLNYNWIDNNGISHSVAYSPDHRTVLEIETSLWVSARVRELVEQSCADVLVYMTRTKNVLEIGELTGVPFIDGKSYGPWLYPWDRAKFADNINADMYVSIHCNAGGGHGTETFYCDEYQSNSQSTIYSNNHLSTDIVFADLVEDKMIAIGMVKPDGTPRRNSAVEDNTVTSHLSVLQRNQRPNKILSEIGFVDTPSDAAKLSDPVWREKYAQVYFEAIVEQLGLDCCNDTQEPNNIISEANAIGVLSEFAQIGVLDNRTKTYFSCMDVAGGDNVDYYKLQVNEDMLIGCFIGMNNSNSYSMELLDDQGNQLSLFSGSQGSNNFNYWNTSACYEHVYLKVTPNTGFDNSYPKYALTLSSFYVGSSNWLSNAVQWVSNLVAGSACANGLICQATDHFPDYDNVDWNSPPATLGSQSKTEILAVNIENVYDLDAFFIPAVQTGTYTVTLSGVEDGENFDLKVQPVESDWSWGTGSISLTAGSADEVINGSISGGQQGLLIGVWPVNYWVNQSSGGTYFG